MPGSVPDHVVWALAVLPIYAHGSVIAPPVAAMLAVVVRTGPCPGVHRARAIVFKAKGRDDALAGGGAIWVTDAAKRRWVLAKGREADAFGGGAVGGNVHVDVLNLTVSTMSPGSRARGRSSGRGSIVGVMGNRIDVFRESGRGTS